MTLALAPTVYSSSPEPEKQLLETAAYVMFVLYVGRQIH